jgi:hypothetical protein
MQCFLLHRSIVWHPRRCSAGSNAGDVDAVEDAMFAFAAKRAFALAHRAKTIAISAQPSPAEKLPE